jgi:hypothetical protein
MNFPVGDSIDRSHMWPGLTRLLDGLWLREAHNVHAHPVDAFEKRAQLRRRQTHDAILNARPAELSFPETLGEQAQSRAVPEHQFHPVGSSGPKAEDRAGERIGFELLPICSATTGTNAMAVSSGSAMRPTFASRESSSTDAAVPDRGIA